MLNVLKKPKDLLRINSIASNLRFRSNFLFNFRRFFIENSFVEIDTPILIKAPAPEDYINAPQAGRFFLRTSPELHMKRLAAAGFEKFFQIGSCFREDEIGRKHNVEFTMLEWYEQDSDYKQFMRFTEKMLRETILKTCGTLKIHYNNSIIDFGSEWNILTVKEAFHKYAATTPEQAIADDEFEIILTEKIEPCLPKDRPLFLVDYPVSMAALSKVKPDDHTVAERWELYIGGLEIANTYSELTDYNEQKKRFDKAHQFRRENSFPMYPDDNDFFESLEYGLPKLGGSALGIDRLIMILTNSLDIKNVVAFTEQTRD